LAKFKAYAKSPRWHVRDETKTVTIAVSHVDMKPKNGIMPTSIAGPRRLIKNMITGPLKWTAVFLVVSAADGPMPQSAGTYPACSASRRAGALVFLNKVDLVDDPELLELVRTRIARAAHALRLPRRRDSDRSRSAKAAYDNPKDPAATKCISDLLDASIAISPAPREIDKPFLIGRRRRVLDRRPRYRGDGSYRARHRQGRR